MRLWRSSLVIITCLNLLGFLPSNAHTIHGDWTHVISELPVSPNSRIKLSTLRPGSTGTEVKTLQTQLQELGYYKGKIDGNYGKSTQESVSKFQQSQKLDVDGIAGATTRERLQTVRGKKDDFVSAGFIAQSQERPQRSERDWTWWLLVAIALSGSLGATAYGVKRLGKLKHKLPTNTKPVAAPLTPTQNYYDNSINPDLTDNLLPIEQPSRLTKVDIIEELISELNSPDSTIRRKAIWDLSQQGDSRAVQPLMDLMLDSDSQQRSLILGALAEIGTRTLKPMNRALAISLQDESPQVRQNAIRDLTRIYDQMAQVSQMLGHALEDTDAEVQETARYALSQMSRIRAISEQKSLPEDEGLSQD